jgi:phage terminase small subunit
MGKLTNKQFKFVNEYFIDCNASQAAIRAGYSPRSAEFQGSKLLAIPAVAEEIARMRKEYAAKSKLTREELLADLKQIKDDNKKTFAPAAIKAIEVIAKMEGWNEPDKIQHSSDPNAPLIIKVVKPDEANNKE